ncbi:D-amino-acid transaminase [Candidatus Sumerlaeota bacterium]|nr:D-amino-acid transaminase [Candidatus Sumerlaeota bacterium]
MSELAFLNGEFLPLNEARVSVEDRGFQFADGVYEVVRVYNGRAFYLAEHIKRLQRSASKILLSLPHSAEEFASICDELINRSGYKEAVLYIQITRGTAPRKHPFPSADVSPTVVLYIREFKPYPAEWWQNGVDTISLPDERWLNCDIKSISLLPNVLAKEQALRSGAFEALLFRDPDIVTEGSATNVYYIKRKTLFTHPATNLILSGITREVILRLASELGLTVRQEPQPLQRFKSADEVFLSSTTIEILPVRSIDGTLINNGKVPGEFTLKIHQLYKEEINRICGE